MELMRAFNPPKGSYRLKLNHRALIQSFLGEVLGVTDELNQKQVIRLMDKYEKLPASEFESKLLEIDPECDFALIVKFMQAQSIEDLSRDFIILAGNSSFQDFKYIITILRDL